MAEARKGYEGLREARGYEQSTCPRCQRYELGFPALSRADNKTKVCSRCGEAEAMEQFNRFPLQTEWLTDGTPVTEYAEVEAFLVASEEAREKLIELHSLTDKE